MDKEGLITISCMFPEFSQYNCNHLQNPYNIEVFSNSKKNKYSVYLEFVFANMV